jgi:purine nucleosidase
MTGSTQGAGRPVILDTDIGSDVDDLLALTMIATEPSLDLIGVTTVYGDVGLRARLAQRVLRLLGRADVPVHAGTARPQSGNDAWWAGHEGDGVDGLDDEEISTSGGVDALLDAVRRRPGEVVVVAIGPLTNIATAIDRDPSWASAVGRLVVMGGEFASQTSEHNVRSDVTAARKVLEAGIPSLWVGLDVTTTVQFDETDLAAITTSGSELSAIVDRQVRTWWWHIGQSSTNPHDPLAVLALLEPGQFTIQRGRWRVDAVGSEVGVLVPDREAPAIEYATSVAVAPAREALRRRLTAALAR